MVLMSYFSVPDLCPKPNITDNPLSKKSHVEDFSEPMPGLFQALTAEPDPHERWLTFTFPVDFDMSLFTPKHEKEMKYHMRAYRDLHGLPVPCETLFSAILSRGRFLLAETTEEEVHPLKPNVMTVNCTVAFMAQCNSWNKCRASCQSMGATSYRWFHDGCCECIGDTCINYGINESRCIHCPLDKEEDDLKDQYDDYGQDEDDLADDEID